MPVYPRAPTEVPSGLIVMWHGTIANIPSGWIICDGNGGTPNLLAKFVEGVATAATNPGATGGATTKYLTHGTTNTSGSATEIVAPDAHGVLMTTAAGINYGTVRDDIADIRPLYYDVAFLMKT